MKLSKSILVVTSLAAVTCSQAITIFGLTYGDQLVRFDHSTPSNYQSAQFISGLSSNETLLGIDFRPANGMLYGLGSFGNIYTLNTSSAQATFVSNIGVQLNGTEFGVDFNPVANRLRVISNLGQNLRINVDTGATIIDGNINQANGSPYIVASAYTNSVANATSTTLYNLDSVSNELKIQNPPNAGTQVVVGPFPGGSQFDVSAAAGFDIVTNGSQNIAFAGYQASNTNFNYLTFVDLTSGSMTMIGQIGMENSLPSMTIRDIAAVPEPASLLALGLGALALRRRKKN